MKNLKQDKYNAQNHCKNISFYKFFDACFYQTILDASIPYKNFHDRPLHKVSFNCVKLYSHMTLERGTST